MKRSLKPSEHQEQVAVIQWWKLACKGYGLPEFSLLAIPNAAKRSYALASYLKAEGLRAGIPDLFLAKPHQIGEPALPDWASGLWIEMKVHPNKPTAAQQEALLYLTGAGYQTMVCYSADHAIEAIKQYLA